MAGSRRKSPWNTGSACAKILGLWVAAVAALVIAAPAHGALQAWSFSFDHLIFLIGDEQLETSVVGNFVADDVNRDGILTLSELKSFEMDGRNFFPDHIELHWDGYTDWPFGETTSTFSFDGALHFSGDSFGYKAQTRYVLSSTEYSQFQDIAGSNAYQTLWGPQTVFTITSVAPPVTEPSAAILLPAGAALLAALRQGRWRVGGRPRKPMAGPPPRARSPPGRINRPRASWTAPASRWCPPPARAAS